MSIATKKGDWGMTSLLFNRRVSKCDPRVEACGAVDELNAALGLARATIGTEKGRVRGWALPGESLPSAALDMARTICRRAERRVCALHEARLLANGEIIVYLNRLSDWLWLLARSVEQTKT